MADLELDVSAPLGGGVWRFPADRPLVLDSGAKISGLEVAYQTYGTLNADKSNAVLVCHALTGDQHVANVHPVTGKPGWWHILVGPGRPLDPERYFIICANVLGGCLGTTGPASINPDTVTSKLDIPVAQSGFSVGWIGTFVERSTHISSSYSEGLQEKGREHARERHRH